MGQPAATRAIAAGTTVAALSALLYGGLNAAREGVPEELDLDQRGYCVVDGGTRLVDDPADGRGVPHRAT